PSHPITYIFPPSLHDALPLLNLSSLNNVAAQQVFTQRDSADKPHDRNQQGGFEVEQAALVNAEQHQERDGVDVHGIQRDDTIRQDRKSTRLNSSHVKISYAVF